MVTMSFHNDYTNSLDKSKFRLSGYRIGSPTSPVTAKQLPEFSARLNEGVTNIEIGTLDPNIFDTVPVEHLESIKQLSKLTGSNVSMHAPMIDPAGFDDKGGWREDQRRTNEHQIVSILEKASKVSKDGNIPVVLHAAGGVFSQQYDKDLNDQVKWKDFEKSEEKLSARLLASFSAQISTVEISIYIRKSATRSEAAEQGLWPTSPARNLSRKRAYNRYGFFFPVT